MTTVGTERVRAIYDAQASVWDRRQGVVERRLIGEGMRRGVANELRGNVLEIGAGTGATFPFARENSSITSLTAVDLSFGMLHQAAIRNSREAKVDPGYRTSRLAQMNAEHLAFRDGSFDTVTTSLMLCTVPDPERALREMARVCTAEGAIVLLEHVRARNPLLAWMQKVLSPMQERQLGCHLDRTTDVLVREMGFRIEREETRFFGVFHLIVARPPKVG